MKRNIFLAAIIICSVALASCGPSRVVVTDRPAVPYYQRPMPPGPNYMWVDGDWIIRNRHYEYQHGYWAAPRYNRRWENGRWYQSRHGWQWQRGYWR